MKLSLEELEKGLLEFDAKDEFKQASIVMVRTVFMDAKREIGCVCIAPYITKGENPQCMNCKKPIQ